MNAKSLVRIRSFRILWPYFSILPYFIYVLNCSTTNELRICTTNGTEIKSLKMVHSTY